MGAVCVPEELGRYRFEQLRQCVQNCARMFRILGIDHERSRPAGRNPARRGPEKTIRRVGPRDAGACESGPVTPEIGALTELLQYAAYESSHAAIVRVRIEETEQLVEPKDLT